MSHEGIRPEDLHIEEDSRLLVDGVVGAVDRRQVFIEGSDISLRFLWRLEDREDVVDVP